MNEKANYISKTHLKFTSPVKRKKPDWIKVRAPNGTGYAETKGIIKKNLLNTVCEEAACPNIGECWEKKHATVMILGRVCTRKCSFCNILSGTPSAVDQNEPKRLANAISDLNLKHIVITSVDRDDLVDGGANHFAKCIREIRRKSSLTTIEILTPDFQRKDGALNIIADSGPDVFNHNLETIPRLYKTIRRGANYEHSLNILNKIKKYNPLIWTKSGLMLGLGETFSEVEEVMDDMIKNSIDFITIGQYLQPTSGHHPVMDFILPSKFKELENMAWQKGFSMVSCSPLTRSSYHADEDFKTLQNNKRLYQNEAS